jgi:cytoskeletal protein CcmA (bactofilin family)
MSTSTGVKRSLENRVILCVDCDVHRALSVSASGNLVCSTCGSANWMHLPTTAIVKESVSIKGELTAEDDLTIEGCVEGRIELHNHNLWINPNGTVNAEIYARSVVIAGSVSGNIHAGEMVEIRSSGSVQAHIECPRISIFAGGQFKGSIDTETRAVASTGLDLSKTQPAKSGSGTST